jgi:two-component system sensor histidine kinase UhpB
MGGEESHGHGADTPPALAAGSRRKLLGWLAVATILVQLVFWLGVRPLLFGRPTLPPLYAISDVQEAQLAAPDATALEQARFSATALPWSSCCSPGYRALRFNLNLPQIPEHGVALVPQVEADNVQIRINDQLVFAQGRMQLPRTTYEANVKRVIHIPSAVFQVGMNRVDYVLARQVMPYFDVGRPIFADYAIAWPLFKFREFILTDYEIIGVAVGAVIALLALALLLRSAQRGLALSLLLLASTWSLLTQFYFWVDPPFSATSRLVYYFALTNALPVCWLNFSDQWTGKPFRWTALFSVLAYATCMAATVWALMKMPPPDGFDRASGLANWFGLAFSAAAILRFVWHILRSGENRVMEFAVFALCITLLAVDFVNEVAWQKASGYVIHSMPLLLLAFVVAFLARNVRLFQSTHEINRLLSERLHAREAELAETYRRESDLVRREAHQAERQRLMRDMHDGVGSQLTSMLFAARRGALPEDQLVDSLQTVIEEIRLLIDSMDSAGDSLAVALESFQQRAAKRLTAAGITLEFQPIPRDLLPECGPRDVLHVLRILQEGIGNALRHARCSRIAIEVAPSGDPAFPVQVVIRDDGVGFAQDHVPGRGLTNMKTRAEAIGGRLTIDRSGAGVSLRLLLGAGRNPEPA